MGEEITASWEASFFEWSNTPLQFFVEVMLCLSTENVLIGKGSVLRI